MLQFHKSIHFPPSSPSPSVFNSLSPSPQKLVFAYKRLYLADITSVLQAPFGQLFIGRKISKIRASLWII